MNQLQAGDLQNKITIQRNTSIGQSDDNGISLETWEDVCTIWANKKGLTGTRFYQASSDNFTANYIYTIRYREDISVDMRIVDSNHIMRLKAPPIEIVRKRWQEIHAEEVVAGGS